MTEFPYRKEMVDSIFKGMRPAAPTPAPSIVVDDSVWLRMGKDYVYDGTKTRFYPVGALAVALDRSVNTIYSWERKKWLAEPRYRGKQQGFGGRRRLYTEEQIRALIKIAEQEGLMDEKPPSPAATRLYELSKEVLS